MPGILEDNFFCNGINMWLR